MKLVRHMIESCIFSIYILKIPRDYLSQFSQSKLFSTQREIEKKEKKIEPEIALINA